MDDPIRQLQHLGRMATMSETTHLLLEDLSDRLANHPSADPLLGDLLAQFVSVELHYHSAVGNFAPSGAVSNDTVTSLAERRDAWLCRARVLLQALCAGSAHSGSSATLASLMLACVCRGMDDLPGAAEALRDAVEAGLDFPLLHYALGVTLLGVAQSCRDGGQPRSRDAFLEAVSAFEAGLCGGPLDARIYQAMSVCLERAGFTSAARDARFGALACQDDHTSRQHPPRNEMVGVAAYLSSPQAVADLTQGETQ